jgi:predicted transposase/invertase (TIGR01784 family)
MSHYPNHDNLHQIAMNNKAVARDLFKHNLPPKILKRMAINHMGRMPKDYFGRFQKHFTDVIYRVPLVDENGQLTDKEAFLILLAEHKSYADKWLPLQLLRYITEIWHAWLDNQRREKQLVEHLPPIWPLIVYHGKKSPYPESTDIRDLFEDRSLAESMLDNPFQLIDLTQVSDEELKKQGLAASFQLLQKHIFERDNWDFVQELLHLIKPVAELLGDDLLLAMLNYMANYGNIDDKERFRWLVAEELPDYEDKFMSIAQQWKEEGKQQGIQQGMRQGMGKIVKHMHATGHSIDDISAMTGLSIDTIKQLIDADDE